jgi:multiple sugar transport system permease protein
MPKKENTTPNGRNENLAYAFLTPTIIIIFFFLLSPMVSGLIMSFYKTSLSGITSFQGLKNYQFLLSEGRFLTNLRLSLIYVLCTLIFSLPLAYIMALLITRNKRGTAFFRSIFLLPWIVAPVVSVLLFRSLVEPNFGPLSWLLEKITATPRVILTEPFWAMATIIYHSVWRSLPFMTLFLAAGISMIPKEFYEAAKVDGAGAWRQFFTLTLPLTKIHLLIVLLTITLWTLQDAETIYALTQGGPGYSTEVMAVRLFKESFINFDLNRGATLGILLLLVGLAFMIAYIRITGKESE